MVVTRQCQSMFGSYDASLGRRCVLGLTLWTHTPVFGFLLFIYDQPFFPWCGLFSAPWLSDESSFPFISQHSLSSAASVCPGLVLSPWQHDRGKPILRWQNLSMKFLLQSHQCTRIGVAKSQRAGSFSSLMQRSVNGPIGWADAMCVSETVEHCRIKPKTFPRPWIGGAMKRWRSGSHPGQLWKINLSTDVCHQESWHGFFQ